MGPQKLSVGSIENQGISNREGAFVGQGASISSFCPAWGEKMYRVREGDLSGIIHDLDACEAKVQSHPARNRYQGYLRRSGSGPCQAAKWEAQDGKDGVVRCATPDQDHPALRWVQRDRGIVGRDPDGLKNVELLQRNRLLRSDPTDALPCPAGAQESQGCSERLPSKYSHTMSQWIVGCLVLLLPLTSQAQSRDASEVHTLIARAVQRRSTVDRSQTRPFQARAHGLVLFGYQLGSTAEATHPRLSKADELMVEVYWQAPGQSKQRVVSWRDTTAFPTDIEYHRDHLGLILDEFGSDMRLGDGDEVRDLTHPLSDIGEALYTFTAGETVRLQTANDTIVLLGIHVRPRVANQPGVVGTLYLERESASLVRFEFTFTSSSYRDPTIEGIFVQLENARSEDQWLPWRQVVEIRRTAARWALPIQSVIRTSWQVESVEFTRGFGAALFRGPPIVGLRAPALGTMWPEAWATVLGNDALRPQSDIAQMHNLARALIGDGSLVRRPAVRPQIASVSSLVRFTDVEGLAIGLGSQLRVGGARTVSLYGRLGTAFDELQGEAILTQPFSGGQVRIWGSRLVVDVADPRDAPSSGFVASILASGSWHIGDYLRRTSAGLGVTWAVGVDERLDLALSWEKATSLFSTGASPASPGRNPALGAGSFGVARLGWTHQRGGWNLSTEGELGAGNKSYGLVGGRVEGRVGGFGVAGRVMASTADLPRSRSRPFGGWGTLLGEPFRAYGGRYTTLLRLDLPIPVMAPTVSVARFGRVSPIRAVGPFFTLGWAAGQIRGAPWTTTEGLRPVLGLRASAFYDMIVIEVGWAIRHRDLGVSVDLGRTFWPIL